MGHNGLPDALRSGGTNGRYPRNGITNDVAVAFAALQVELTSFSGGSPSCGRTRNYARTITKAVHQTQPDVIAGKADHLREEVAAWAEWTIDQLR